MTPEALIVFCPHCSVWVTQAQAQAIVAGCPACLVLVAQAMVAFCAHCNRWVSQAQADALRGICTCGRPYEVPVWGSVVHAKTDLKTYTQQ